jgi:hypothetical protein
MENSLDNLLAPALRQSVEDNLGKVTLNKIEQRLAEKHGLGVVQAIKEFSKLDDVLQEFFGQGAKGLESRFVQNIIKIEKSKKESENWITLKDQSLSKVILDSFADSEKKIMMESVMDQPLEPSAILDKCHLSQTSGHDKLNYLVDNGLLVPVFDTENDTPKYQTPFSNVKMDLEKKEMVVKIQLQKSAMQQSAILQVVQ